MKKIFFTLMIIAVVTGTAMAQCSVSSASSSPTLCVNTCLPEPVTHITNNVTAIGNANNLPAGVAAIWVNNTIIISGSPTVAGTFNYSIPLIGENCSTETATGQITVTALPTVSINGANIICVGTTTQLSPTSGGTWTSSDNAVATVANNGLVTGVSDGTATFTFTNSSNCQATTSEIMVSSLQPVLIKGANAICVGTSTNLSPTSGGIWTSSNNAIATVTNSGVVTGVSGGTATFTFTNLANCQATTSAVTVNPLPTVSVLGGENSICKGISTKLLPTTGGTWISNTPAVATVTSDGAVTGKSNGIATFTFTEDITGCQATISVAILLGMTPNIDNIVAKTNADGIPYILVYPNPDNEDLSYQWYCGDNKIEGETEQFYYPKDGLDKKCDYKVFVSYKHSESCGNFTDIYTKHNNAPQKISSEMFTVYPNPSNGNFVVAFNKDVVGKKTTATVCVLSLQGNKIMEQKTNCSDDFVFNSNIENGTYMLKINTENNSETKILIIKK